MRIENINVPRVDIVNFNSDCDYKDILDTMLFNRVCEEYRFSNNQHIKLGEFAFMMKRAISSSQITKRVRPEDVSAIFRALPLIYDLQEATKCIPLIDNINELLVYLDNRISIDGGKTYVAIDAFKSDAFRSIIGYMNILKVHMVFREIERNDEAFFTIKALLTMNRIETLCNDFTSNVSEFQLKKA